MLAYLDSVSTEQLESVRFISFGLLILANMGVVLGVVLEKEANPPALKSKGWRILVVSLSIEILFSSLVFGIDSEISRQQKSEILRVRQEAANRDLTPEELAAIVKALDILRPDSRNSRISSIF